MSRSCDSQNNVLSSALPYNREIVYLWKKEVFLRFTQELLMHARIQAKQNKSGIIAAS